MFTGKDIFDRICNLIINDKDYDYVMKYKLLTFMMNRKDVMVDE